MTDCIFCKIINGDIPSKKIFEDNNYLAFLDINPVSKGHMLVITKRHFETFNEIPTMLLPEYMKLIQKISTAVKTVTGAPGYNIMINNKEVAGQVVPHVHFHIIPRNNKEEINLNWNTIKYEDGELEQLGNKIKDSL